MRLRHCPVVTQPLYYMNLSPPTKLHGPACGSWTSVWGRGWSDGRLGQAEEALPRRHPREEQSFLYGWEEVMKALQVPWSLTPIPHAAGDGDRKLTAEEEEARRIAEMGKPVLGENCRLEVIIEESYDFKVT